MIGDGNVDAIADQSGFDMGRHIVAAFKCVFVIGLIFGNKAIEDALKIYANGGIRIFIDAQTCGGMFDVNVENARFWQMGEGSFDGVGDEVKTSWMGAELNFFLHIILVTSGG